MKNSSTDWYYRRGFLKKAGLAGIGGAGLTVGTGVGTAAHKDTADIVFDDDGEQQALVPPSKGPLEAAVRVKKADLPDGGWIVITQDNLAPNFPPPIKTDLDVVGWSSQRLGSGHFKNFLVQVRLGRFDSGDTLYASLWGDDGSQGEDFPGKSYDASSGGVEVTKP